MMRATHPRWSYALPCTSFTFSFLFVLLVVTSSVTAKQGAPSKSHHSPTTGVASSAGTTTRTSSSVLATGYDAEVDKDDVRQHSAAVIPFSLVGLLTDSQAVWNVELGVRSLHDTATESANRTTDSLLYGIVWQRIHGAIRVERDAEAGLQNGATLYLPNYFADPDAEHVASGEDESAKRVRLPSGVVVGRHRIAYPAVVTLHGIRCEEEQSNAGTPSRRWGQCFLLTDKVDSVVRKGVTEEQRHENDDDEEDGVYFQYEVNLQQARRARHAMHASAATSGAKSATAPHRAAKSRRGGQQQPLQSRRRHSHSHGHQIRDGQHKRGDHVESNEDVGHIHRRRNEQDSRIVYLTDRTPLFLLESGASQVDSSSSSSLSHSSSGTVRVYTQVHTSVTDEPSSPSGTAASQIERARRYTFTLLMNHSEASAMAGVLPDALRLHVTRGLSAEERRAEARQRQRAEVTTFYRRWAYPVLYLAALYVLAYALHWCAQWRALRSADAGGKGSAPMSAPRTKPGHSEVASAAQNSQKKRS